MKYYRMTTILSIIILCFPFINGEEMPAMETLSWANQGVEFDVPKGVQITENSKDSFSAEFDDFYIHLTLFTPPSTNSTAVINATLEELSDKMEINIIDNGELKNKGLSGAWVEGPMQSGAMILMGLLTNEDAKVAILCKIIYYPSLGSFADEVLDSIRYSK